MSEKNSKVSEPITKWVSAHYNRTPVSDGNTEQIAVREFETDNLARIEAKYGLTLNLGNYESARVDVAISLPCYREEIEEAFEEAFAMCQKEIQDQVKGIREGS